MGAVQGHDGRAEAGFELQAGVTRVIEQRDLGWQVHGLNYGGAPPGKLNGCATSPATKP